MEPSNHPVASDLSIAKLSHALEASTLTEAHLITLPTELILMILERCKKGNLEHCQRGTIAALSRVNKQLREACIPIMFEMMALFTEEYRLHDHLKAIDGSHFLKIVRNLRLCTNQRDPTNKHNVVSRPCNKQAPALLAKVLGQMTNLQGLRLDLEDGNQSLLALLRNEFNGMAITSVRRLMFTTTFIVSSIPDVFSELRVLRIDVRGAPQDTPGLATIAPKLKAKLHTLHIYKFVWTMEDIREIVDLFPDVENLAVGGEVERVKISGLVPIFKRFSNLKHLALTDLHNFEGSWADLKNNPRLKFHYFLIRRFWRDGDLKEEQDVVAKKFFRGCPKLIDVVFETCGQDEWVGANRFRPIKDDESGEVNEVSKEEGDFWPSL